MRSQARNGAIHVLKRGIGPRSTSLLMSLGLCLRAGDCENAWQVGLACPSARETPKAGKFSGRARARKISLRAFSFSGQTELPEYCPDKIVSFGQAADTTKGGGFRRPDFTCESSYRVRPLFVYQPPVGGGFMRLRSGGTFDAPTWFFQRNPPFAFNPTVGVPETPPEPPFRIATQSGGVLVCETNQPISFRRSNGGDWTEALTRNRLEHSPLRRHYFNAGFIPANAKGGNR